jgi:hypothetical protein
MGPETKVMGHKSKEALELESDAWSRFELAFDVVVKSPPQHRKAKSQRLKAA